MLAPRALLGFALLISAFACGSRTQLGPRDDTGEGGAAGATTGPGAGGTNGEPCGFTTCGPGFSCCNPACGLCVPAGNPCPGIGCTTTSGSTGSTGSTVVSGTSSTSVGPTTTTATA